MNRILVVDDDKIVLKLVEKAFPAGTVEMAFAVDGNEALAVAEGFRPDLVVLDIIMPGGIDGYEVCRRLKSAEKTAEAMVLVLSAKTSLESRLLGYESLADDYLIKPFDAKELVAKAGILLRLKNAKDELQAVNRNLTALVEARTRDLVRKEHQALIGQLVQGLVHNIQGPMAVIQSRAELTIADLRSLSEQSPASLEALAQKLSRHQEMIVDAVGKVGLLVHNLLEKSRSEASAQHRKINLNELVERELEFLEADPQIHRKVEKRFSPAPDLPEIYGVYADFSQVVYNLVKNAADAMSRSEQKRLDISTRYDADHVYMAFADTGEGLPSGAEERIFERFFSTKSRDDRGAGGSGLGLFTCLQLMEGYGAEIRAENRPGGGSRFTVKIPRTKDGRG